jgi:hypothetical protein
VPAETSLRSVVLDHQPLTLLVALMTLGMTVRLYIVIHGDDSGHFGSL